MKVDVADTASAVLRAMGRRVADLTPLMQAMGRHMVVSVRSNFLQGGRPKQWEALKGVVVIEREGNARKGQRKQGRARMGGPLVLTGDLKSSVGFTPEPKDLILWARPEPLVKGPVHQYGTDRAGRSHKVVIPARPFLVFQDEDLQWFRDAAAGYIRVGRSAP